MEIALLLVGGLITLTLGADWLVRGSSRLAILCGISPLVVGLTVVALGTSAPELVVSAKSAFDGQVDVALGNVVGSNIFNILVVVGLAAIIIPLRVEEQLVRLEVPIMIGVSLLLTFFVRDGMVSRVEAAAFLVIFLVYLVYTIRKSRAARRETTQQYEAEFGAEGQPSVVPNVLFLILGLALLILGAQWFVDGATAVARIFGVSELVIGLTIVSVGTSLPELATSAVAAWKGERDIALGNAVGSNICNILWVLGVTAAITPVPVNSQALVLDIPVMLGVALITFPVVYAYRCVSRLEGSLLVVGYVVYLGTTVLVAQDHPSVETVEVVLLTLGIPVLFGFFLLHGGWYWWQKRTGRIEVADE